MAGIARSVLLDKYISRRDCHSFEQVISNVISEHQILHHHTKTLTPAVISTFKNAFQTRWRKANYINGRFEKNNSVWLSKELKLQETEGSTQHEISNTSEAGNSKRGRSSADFKTASERTKRRKTEVVRKKYSAEELVFAAQMKLRNSGKNHAAKICKEAA